MPELDGLSKNLLRTDENTGAGSLVFIEPTFSDEQHASVNAGLIRMALQADAVRKIRFFATSMHSNAVKELLPAEDSERVDVTLIEVGPSGGIKLRRAAKQAGVLMAATQDRPACLLVLSSGPETFFASRYLCWRRPDFPIRIMLHGNLTDAVAKRSRDPRRRFVDYKSGLRAAQHPRIRLLVLEAAIQHAMNRFRIPGSSRTLVVPHPVSEREFNRQTGLTGKPCLTIGFIGHAKRSKGFADYLSLARQAQVDANNKRIRFVLVGFLAERFPLEELQGMNCSIEPLSREAFLHAIRTIDYACFPFAPTVYELTASGSILDAACALRPLVARAYPTLVDIEREFGPIGFLCSTMDEMRALVADSSRLFDPDMYLLFQKNLKRLRESRLPSALAMRLNDALEA